MLMAALLLQATAPSSSTLDKSVACQASRLRQDHAAMVRACIRLKPAQVYEGVWYDTFEGQEFFDRATTAAVVARSHSRVWLEIDRSAALIRAHRPERIADLRTPRSYRVRFVGAEAFDMNCSERDSFGWSSCYGHEGAFPGMVLVDRILSIDAL